MDLLDVNHNLARFRGGKFRLWDFSPSHDRLAIELSHADEQPAYLVLLGCTYIQLPTIWTAETPTIESEESAFTFADKGVKVEFVYEFQFREEYDHR